jgi:hypothetical protein
MTSVWTVTAACATENFLWIIEATFTEAFDIVGWRRLLLAGSSH